MPEKDRSIQIGSKNLPIDWVRSSKAIRVRKGRIAVQMVPTNKQVSGLYLPPKVGANLRSDIGVVIATGDEDMPEVGTLVCVAPYNGCWLDEADLGFTASTQVRVYGTYKDGGEVQYEDWWESVVCDVNYRAYGDKIIFKLDDSPTEERGILLPDIAKERNGMATVIEVGPLVSDLRKGDRINVNLAHLDQVGFRFDLEIEKGLCMETEMVINYVINTGIGGAATITAGSCSTTGKGGSVAIVDGIEGAYMVTGGEAQSA